MSTRREIRLKGTITRHEAEDLWVATVDQLPVASCGRTREEAWRNIDSALELWFKAYEEAGAAATVIQKYGLKIEPAEDNETRFKPIIPR